MSSTVSVRGSERILNKLRLMRENKQFYEAHQNYRTIYFRYLSAKKFKELQELLFEGADWFLDMKEYNSGADLACLYIDSLSADPEIVTDKEARFNLSKNIGVLHSKIPAKSPERMQFTVSALKLDPNHFDVPQIHHRFAVTLWQEGNFSDSRYHFLHSSPQAGSDCATLLIQYQISKGLNSEADLFIVQFILQLLCARTACRDQPSNFSLTQKNDLKLDNVAILSLQQALANNTLQIYTANHPKIRKDCPPFMFPLLNFVWLLLLAIQSEKSSQFRILCELYSTALSRDPEYKRYLTKIGELYFGIRPQNRNQAMGGLLGNLLQSLMDDDDDEDEEDEPSAAGKRPFSKATSRVNQIDDDLD